MLNEVWSDVHPSVKSPYSSLSSIKTTDKVSSNYKTLEWDLKSSEKIQQALTKSQDISSAQVDDVDSYCINFKDFGREKIKQWKISPDAAMQMAFQLAYSRVAPSQGSPATYESCAMKPYFHGRTETIRSCTQEAIEMVKAFNAPNASVKAKTDSLVKAAGKHVEVANGVCCC